MNVLHPMLADAINFPLVLLFGVGVLIPLLAFQVGVEGAVLARCWRIPFRELARCVFLANCWSLAAGIPVKIFNAWMYSWLLPSDLTGFFTLYPYAVALGTLIYFLVTWIVESRYAMKWLKSAGHPVSRSRLWSGVLVANLATYAVLAPVHYLATRPIHNVQEFTTNTAWANRPPTRMLYIDTATRHLQSIDSDGSQPETVVPLPVADYQVSADLNLCLFRAPGGGLYLYRRDTDSARLVWETAERYFMENVAFSPSGRFVAWFEPTKRMLEVADLQSTNRWSAAFVGEDTDPRIAWTTNDSQLAILSRTRETLLQVTPEKGLAESKWRLEELPQFAPVYGRVGGGHFFSGQDWGQHYSSEKRDGLSAWAFPGLGACLRIFDTNQPANPLVTLAVNPGLIHLSGYGFAFTHPAFLADGRECLFETPRDIYLLDVERKRVGHVTSGHSFILLDQRYAKGRRR